MLNLILFPFVTVYNLFAAQQIHESNLNSTLQDKEAEIWISEYYYPNVYFTTNSTVIIQYNGQCEYEYAIRSGADKNSLLYDQRMDCTTNMKFQETFELQHYPRQGDSFITYHTVADTLYFEYLYNDWIDSVNAQHPLNPPFAKKFIKIVR